MSDPLKTRYTLEKVAVQLGVRQDLIVQYIREQWIQPPESEETQSEFVELDQEDLARLQLILELQNDFGVNSEAIPIILHLVDQLHAVRQEIQRHLPKAS